MAISQRFYLLIFLILSFNAMAEGWVSSGGRLFRDEHNPWFIDKNAKEINVCFKTDPKGTGLDQRQVEILFRQALQYWRHQFTEARKILPLDRGQFDVGNAKFRKTICDEDTDLKVKVGSGTLTEYERTFLQGSDARRGENQLRKFVGVAVRTNYDPRTLRGKGFIYLASDRGTDAYLNDGTLVERAWDNANLFVLALIHELGHVFGIPHLGNGIMAEAFLDQLLKKELFQIFTSEFIEGFLIPNDFFISGNDLKGKKKFLSLKENENNLEVSFNFKEKTVELIAYKDGDWGNPRVAGQIVGLNFWVAGMRTMPTNYVYLNDQQTIFKPSDLDFSNFLIGPPRIENSASGTLVNFTTFEETPLQMEIAPNFFRAIGLIGGKMKNILVYNSPISIGTYFQVGQ